MAIDEPSITCCKQAQCSSTHFCNIRQRVCMLKYAVNSTCERDLECSDGKCYDYICRQSCESDDDCSLTKEYCTVNKYCNAKYCGMCLRDAQCANNLCEYFHCTSDDCTRALDILFKQS
ncbi:unnamed protein product [Rotaria sordida]|uniref:Uncharacterized protein n=1 Tax=Rotaria sordida TaxID=392033 RepID=A0A814MNK6_9BILA|nr:unnamed protein product [Rotaria sordida]CAF0966029.1 unnamed protein product [Rotaria sordida]CAF1015364.1 unnamed protein product [Rotaria sordida]CAF1081890.1 unnamed protein product [Rotaria sordida]CAF1271801.1 unnamed protein product [Rotaria sordida]